MIYGSHRKKEECIVYGMNGRIRTGIFGHRWKNRSSIVIQNEYELVYRVIRKRRACLYCRRKNKNWSIAAQEEEWLVHVVMRNKWYCLCDQRRKKDWSMGLHKEEGLDLWPQEEQVIVYVITVGRAGL